MTPSVRHRARARLDSKLAVIKPIDRFARPPKGWIRAIRDAIGMSGSQLGKRMGVTPQAVADLEKSETVGKIGLDTLRRAAEAMDCVLVYAIVPNTSLIEMVDERARALALKALNRVSHSMALEDQRVDRDFDARIATYVEQIRDRDLWDS
jgi:predicted DNA-binding mobile mystery protein A